jgi:predicted permease
MNADLQFSLRQLRRNPQFTLTAVVSLALGIGATVAVFSVIYAVLLHPFPYADVDRLANLSISQPGNDPSDQFFKGPQLRELRNLSAFESIASWRLERLAVTGGEMPEPVAAYFGIGTTFSTFGVPPLLGRNLGPSDSPDGQQPQPVVELHYRFWKRHFNGDPGVLGRTVELDHKQYTIVGVTQPNFTAGWGTDVYLPQEISSPEGGGVIVKMRPGVTPAIANAELQPLLDQFAQQNPRSYPKSFRADIRPLAWETTHNMGPTLYLLFGAVGLLLAIGCGNVSILLLARNTARQHEFAVRSAVGAGWWRIVRQLLVESLLLAAAGTIVGIVLADRLLTLIVLWLPIHLFPPDVAIRINMPVLLFSVALAILTAVCFGLVPALQSAKPAISNLMQSRRTAGSLRGKRLHGTLVAGQIALTLLLLTLAGTAIERFLEVLRVPLGYNPHQVIAIGFPLQDNAYTSWQARLNYFEQLNQSVAHLPDVVSASNATIAIPPYAGWEQTFEVLGQPADAPDAQRARISFVGAEYFRTLETPLLRGRLWTPAEVARGAPQVVVNETFARHYSTEGEIVGRAVKIAGLRDDPPGTLLAPHADGWMQVIGIVTDSVNNGLDQPVRPAIFVPSSVELWQSLQVVVRTRGTPEATENEIRRQIAGVNRDQMVVATPGNLETWLQEEPVWAQGRLISALFGGFSVLALTLSAIGLYSVVSYSVAQRTPEFGIRIALGASRAHVARVVMASAGISIGLGILTGLALSLGLARVIAGWVGNTAGNPMMAACASSLLIIVAGLACWVPARRAMGVDPMTSLRCE